MFNLYSLLQLYILFFYRTICLFLLNANTAINLKQAFKAKYYSNISKAFLKPHKYIKKERIFLNIFLIMFLHINLLMLYFSFFDWMRSGVRLFKESYLSNKKRIFSKVFIYNKSLQTYNFINNKFFLSFNLFFSFYDNFKIFFLRKNIIYLKSKFSKVRLFTKNIVYFSLLLNVIVVNELHLMYYNMSINYSYFFLIFFIVIVFEWTMTFFKTNLGW